MKAILYTLAILTIVIGLFWAMMGRSQPAEAAVHNDITICATLAVIGIECQNVQVPIVTTTVKVRVPGPTTIIRVPAQTVHVQVPGPTRTRTVTVPGGTRTVTIPGPTVYRTEHATAPKTVRQKVENGKTTTTTINPKPTALPTATRTVKSPSAEKTVGIGLPETKYKDHVKTATVVKRLGLGLLATLGLVALLLLSMWLGYGWGTKDTERRETSFMKSLLRRGHRLDR